MATRVREAMAPSGKFRLRFQNSEEPLPCPPPEYRGRGWEECRWRGWGLQPLAPMFSIDEVIGLGGVFDFHVGGVPFDGAAEAQGDDADHGDFGDLGGGGEGLALSS